MTDWDYIKLVFSMWENVLCMGLMCSWSLAIGGLVALRWYRWADERGMIEDR